MSSFAVPAKPTKSLTTSELEERLTRHRNLQNGMEHILGKLKHDAKGVTIDDAQWLADNAEDGDEWTASIIDAVEDLALRNEDEQAVTPHPASEISNVPQDIIERLRSDPSSITEEDARRFSETVEARDERSARLVSAVESLAAAHNDIYSKDSSLSQSPHPSLLTVVKDLHAAVEANPEDIDAEILRTTQSIVSKMQKAIGHTNAPHPELEAELQQEYAKIVPKVECGVVTKAEADHLHSLEARAHGHTERGGLTAQAQSVAARRERQTSFSSGSGNVRSRANSRSFPPHKQALHDTGSETSGVEPKDQRSPERSGVAPSNTSVRRLQSLSESTNTARGDGRYDAAFPKLQAYGSFERGSGGSENMPRTQKHESGQQGR